MTTPNLLGDRVHLRPARPSDADALAAGLEEDPRSGAMLGMEPEEQNADFLRASFVAAQDDPPTSFWFVIEDRAGGDVLGEIGLVDLSRPNRRAALSVLVLPRSRRAGVAREAIDLVVRWAQDELRVHRVELHTYTENVPMQRLAEAAGFEREGVLRDHSFARGRFMDSVVYARLPSRPSS